MISKFRGSIYPGYGKYSYIWAVINNLIPMVGIYLLSWTIFELMFFLRLELVLLGIVGILKILTSHSGVKGILKDIIYRINQTALFALLFGTFTTIIIAFSSIHVEFGRIIRELPGFELMLDVLIVNYLLHYLADFIFSRKYKKANPAASVLEPFIHLLPISLFLLFLIFPVEENVPLISYGFVFPMLIILLRTGMEIYIIRVKSMESIDETNVEELGI
jgi:hypothetical protein